jgi:hypothetical protein
MKNPEFIDRQQRVLSHTVSDYRLGRLSLDSLVRRIEGVSAVIDSSKWSAKVRPIILSLEQVNAAVIETKIGLSESNKAIVNQALEELDTLLSSPDWLGE